MSIPARAGETGRLFGSITVADVVEAVRTAGGPTLDKRRVTIPTAVKKLGTHGFEVRLHPDVLAKVALQVVSAQ